MLSDTSNKRVEIYKPEQDLEYFCSVFVGFLIHHVVIHYFKHPCLLIIHYFRDWESQGRIFQARFAISHDNYNRNTRDVKILLLMPVIVRTF